MLQFCFAFLLGLSLLVRSQGLVPPALINQVLHLQESGCLDIHLDLVKYAISGAVAGGSRALSRGLSFPFDTIKTLEQFSTKDENKTAASQPQLIAKDYFRGVVPAVVSAIPSTRYVTAVLFLVLYCIATSTHLITSLTSALSLPLVSSSSFITRSMHSRSAASSSIHPASLTQLVCRRCYWTPSSAQVPSQARWTTALTCGFCRGY